MSTAIFYHAGCPVCLGAEQLVADAVDRSKYQVEVVHLGEHADRVVRAEAVWVKSVPVLVLNDQVFHITMAHPLMT